MTTYHLNNSGTRTQYDDIQDFEDAVRDAINEWVIDTECPVLGDSDAICCANHETRRFRMCPACVAMEQAIEDDQMWMIGDVPLPYEIRLPRTGSVSGRHIRAWEN